MIDAGFCVRGEINDDVGRAARDPPAGGETYCHKSLKLGDLNVEGRRPMRPRAIGWNNPGCTSLLGAICF